MFDRVHSLKLHLVCSLIPLCVGLVFVFLITSSSQSVIAGFSRNLIAQSVLGRCSPELKSLDRAPFRLSYLPCRDETKPGNQQGLSAYQRQSMVPTRLNNPRYFFVLGLAQYANGLTEEAYTSFSEAARLGVDPKLALYWLGLTQRPSSSFIPDSWIKVDLSRFLRDLAKHNADKHFLADAVEQYKVALALSSAAQRPQKERAAWYAELASVYEALQNHAAAEAAYKNALLLDEQEAFRYNLAKVLIEEKEDEAAQAELQRIQGEITHSPPYWVLLSQVQTELDNYSAAEASLIHATQLGAVRDRAWAHSVLATFYLQQGRLTDALQSQRVAVTLDPEYVWWRLHLGALYRQASDLDRADEQFKSALRLAADAASIAEAHLELGKLQLQRNQPGEAKQHFKVVLNMGLDSGDIRVMQATQLLLELDRQP